MSADNQLKNRSIGDKIISITAPAFNEAESLEELCKRIRISIEKITENYEIVIVDNDSSDCSLEILRRLGTEESRIKYVKLSRNFGHYGGIIAGMEHCSGDIIITMDADLQHPPEVLPNLLEEWCKGYNIIGTRKKKSKKTSALRHSFNQMCYKGLGRVIGFPLTSHQSDFRLLDRSAMRAIILLPEKDKFLRGLAHWIGFTQTSIEYEVEPRRFGKTKISVLSELSFAINGMISFSVFPLRFVSIMGFIVAFSAFFGALITLVGWLSGIYETPRPGWLTIAIGVYFIGGVQLIGIGLLGEYLGQTLKETRKRPSFVVVESTAGSSYAENGQSLSPKN